MASSNESPGIDHGAALERLTAMARDRLPPVVPDADLARREGYARLRQRLERRPLPRALPWLVGIPVAAAAGVAMVLAVLPWAAPAISVVAVAGGRVDETGWVRAPADRETDVRFSDGTEVRLDRASRGRVASTSRRGGRVMLEQGRAQVRVVPRKGNNWVFDAGPCRVHVTGTMFDMRWSALEQVLEVALTAGSVTVQGPPAPNGITLRKGQRLVMDVRQGFARIETVEEPAPTARPQLAPVPPPPTAALAEAPGPSERPPTARPSQRRPEPAAAPPSWSARVLAGEFHDVLAEARGRGVPEVLRRGAAPDVMALADAARFAGVSSLAREALLSVRARFGQSAQAHRAAFLLGRVAEDNQKDLAVALDWYRTYLAEAPAGAYRAEALGRRMAATLKLQGAARARPLATEYLDRYPDGPYAEPARAIVKGQ